MTYPKQAPEPQLRAAPASTAQRDPATVPAPSFSHYDRARKPNGLDRDAIETGKHVHWAVDLFLKSWPMLLVVGGLIYAAGQMTAKIDALGTQIAGQAEARKIEQQTVKDAFAGQNERLSRIETAFARWEGYLTAFVRTSAPASSPPPLPSPSPVSSYRPEFSPKSPWMARQASD